MKIVYSKKGMAVTYSTGEYEEYDAMQAALYDGVSDTFIIIWNDGEVAERETDAYFSVQSLDNGDIIEF